MPRARETPYSLPGLDLARSKSDSPDGRPQCRLHCHSCAAARSRKSCRRGEAPAGAAGGRSLSIFGLDQRLPTSGVTPPPQPRRAPIKRVKAGVHTDPGGLGYNEDESVVHAPRQAGYAICAVYDGHGGSQAARLCRERLHVHATGSVQWQRGDARGALKYAFRAVEAEIRSLPANGGRRSGATALVALVTPQQVLHLAWAGDCRAVLCRAGGTAHTLTTDHTAACERERQRVEREGGTVAHGRLGGFLEVTRALGDLDEHGFKPAGLSAAPQLKSQPLRSPDDEFLILATDGLWDALSADDAVRIARDELRAYEDAALASEKLVEAALRRKADDNVTAMVLWFNPIPEAAAEVPRRPRLMLTKSKKEVAKEGTSDCGGVPSALMSELGQS